LRQRVTKAGHSLKGAAPAYPANFSSTIVVVKMKYSGSALSKRDDFDILIIFDLIHQHSAVSEHLRIKRLIGDC